eukprot:COSAG06_NODE_2217_length_7324_cov_7.546298_11_plen_133_part_00
MMIARRMEGRPLGAHGRAERRFRQLSTKQQQLAPAGCYRNTVQRKLREDDAPIGTLGLPHEQLRARAQPPLQGCGVAASRRRPPLRILTAERPIPGQCMLCRVSSRDGLALGRSREGLLSLAVRGSAAAEAR